MRSMRLAMVALGCVACMPAAHAQRAEPRRLPADVRAFVERRYECDHFRGEASPDPSRAAQISRELERLCTGTDAELARLKRAHARNRAVQRALADYDPNVEQTGEGDPPEPVPEQETRRK